MATTENGIYYPTDGTQPADVLSDMKKMAESIDLAINDNTYDDTKIKEDITKIKKEQETQNKSIEKNAENIEDNATDIQDLKAENANLKAQIPTGQATGTEITLNGSSNLELTDFSIAINNSAHLVVSNKNLLSFSKVSGNGITFDKNRITIIDSTGYLYAGKTLVGGNKFLSGKRVIFTTVTNGTISNISGTLDFIIHTNKTQYRFQKKHTIGTYNDDIKSEVWQFADDEYITSILVYTTGATCNLTIDVQVSIVDAEFIEHQGAEFQITSTNKDEIIKQIIENGTYQDVTHFYTTDETHANMSLEYYQSLDTALNKYKEQLPVRTSSRNRN